MASIYVEKDTGLPGLVRAAHLMPARANGGSTGAHSLEPVKSNGSRMEPGASYAKCAEPDGRDFLSLMDSLETNSREP